MLSSKKARALLAYLALLPDKPHSREGLATLLWGDRMDEQARHSLRQALSALRKALGDAHGRDLIGEDDSVRLSGTAVDTDVRALESYARDVSTATLEAAARLYEGSLLDGLRVDEEGFDAWLASERERVHVLAIGLLERLALHQEQSGALDEAIATARHLVSIQPVSEEGHRLLMRLLAASGRRTDALQQYQACVDALRRELDSQPSPQTTRLFEELRDRPEGAAPTGGYTQTSAAFQPGFQAASPAPDKPSVAVLSFANLSKDPQQGYFSDGITEDIITDLCKLSGLTVVAYRSTATSQGNAVDATTLGRRLGVGYLLEGSVRKASGRVRVTAQLVEAGTGHYLWSERFDRSLEDVFSVQDEITTEIVTALDVRLVSGEEARVWRKSLQHPQARDCFYRALANVHAIRPDAAAETERLFREVVKLEPQSAQGYVGLSMIAYQGAAHGWIPDVEGLAQEGVQHARVALARDHDNALAWMYSALNKLLLRDFDGCEAESERAVSLMPGSAFILGRFAMLLGHLGRYQDLVAAIQRAKRLSPLAPPWHDVILAGRHRALAEFDEAIRLSIPAVRQLPHLMRARCILTASYAGAGRLQAAREQAQGILTMDPQFGIERFFRSYPHRDAMVLESFSNQLQKSGLPE
jgi:TolB-like protein